jgi:Mrp family chromosome partitioning ATPase
MHECEICEKSFVCEYDRHLHNSWIKKSRLSMIRKVLIINSNKGGLGNTIFSALLAAKMKKMNYKIALMETSFSSVLPYYFNYSSENGLELISSGIIPPVSTFGYPYLSPSLFMIREPHVVAWDDESTMRFLRKMIINTNWGDTDILIIDVASYHANLIKDLKTFLGDKLHNAVLIVDYRQASTDYAKAYIKHFEEILNVLYVLLSPAKRKAKEDLDIYGTKHDVSALPFLDSVYASDAKPDQVIESIHEIYSHVLEEVSTSCLSIF